MVHYFPLMDIITGGVQAQICIKPNSLVFYNYCCLFYLTHYMYNVLMWLYRRKLIDILFTAFGDIKRLPY